MVWVGCVFTGAARPTTAASVGGDDVTSDDVTAATALAGGLVGVEGAASLIGSRPVGDVTVDVLGNGPKPRTFQQPINNSVNFW